MNATTRDVDTRGYSTAAPMQPYRGNEETLYVGACEASKAVYSARELLNEIEITLFGPQPARGEALRAGPAGCPPSLADVANETQAGLRELVERLQSLRSRVGGPQTQQCRD